MNRYTPNSYDHRNTGIKGYSSYINTDVYGRDQNTASHLLKVKVGASNNVCVNCIVSPLDGNK